MQRGIQPYNPIIHKRAYLIARNNQVVQLVESHQGVFQGQIMSYLWKIGRRSKSAIQEFLPIRAAEVKSLMAALEAEQYEQLPDESKDLGIRSGLDGDTYSFISFSAKGVNIAEYWCPTCVNLPSRQSPDHDKIRSIIGLVDEVVSFKASFLHLRNTLLPGIYHYGGISLQVL